MKTDSKRRRPRTMEVKGKTYVLLTQAEYDQLTSRVKESMPAYPELDASGHYPAVAYARASIAREIVSTRARLGLSQRELAARAGVRVETLCRIETGKHTASTGTIVKIDRVLKAAQNRVKPPRKRA